MAGYSLDGSLVDVNGHVHVSLHQKHFAKHDEGEVVSVEANRLFQARFGLWHEMKPSRKSFNVITREQCMYTLNLLNCMMR